MSNGDVVLDIQNQEHLPTLTPADVNFTLTSNDDEIPSQEHIPTLTPADENPAPTSIDDDIPIQQHVPHFFPSGELRASNDQFLTSRLEEEIGKSNEECNSSEQITKIQPIPQIMFQQRKFGEDYYRPRAMTIGLIGLIYASKKNSLDHLDEWEELKLKFAAQFIRNSGKTSDELLVSIKNEIGTLSACFHIQVLKKFKWLRRSLDVTLLLDGCLILQFIYSRVRDKLKELQINNRQASLIEQDLFLMQNQIPFRVLEILMDQLPREGCFTRTVLQQSIDIFIRKNLMTPENILKGNYRDFYERKQPVHLLDILRSGLLYAFDSTNIGRYRDPSFKYEHKREYFRNIEELKAAGIKLESGGISCLGDVTFTSFGWFRARLKLPPLIVNDSTGRKLWNLVAYEMCPDNCNSDYGVTSYVCLLDSLIDNEEDVKELRSASILRNRLSSDKEVAELFNKICYDIVSDSDQAYLQVKQKIEMHLDKLWADSSIHDSSIHAGILQKPLDFHSSFRFYSSAGLNRYSNIFHY